MFASAQCWAVSGGGNSRQEKDFSRSLRVRLVSSLGGSKELLLIENENENEN